MRPGSRTVVYCPDSVSQVLDLARRGFRVLVVHHDQSFLQDCRSQLRDAGLASLLMGAYQLQEEIGKGLSLAKNFYDLVIAFAPLDDLEMAKNSLGPGGELVSLS